MWPDRVSNPGPLTYESGALPTALRGPANIFTEETIIVTSCLVSFFDANPVRFFQKCVCDWLKVENIDTVDRQWLEH